MSFTETRLRARSPGRRRRIDGNPGREKVMSVRPIPAHEIRVRIEKRDLSAAVIVDWDFSDVELCDVHAQRTRFVRCTFRRAVLVNGDFDRTSAPECDFREAVLISASFYEADLRGARFDGANLARSEFLDCDLRGASFANADLRGAMFADCEIEGVSLEGAQRKAFSID